MNFRDKEKYDPDIIKVVDAINTLWSGFGPDIMDADFETNDEIFEFLVDRLDEAEQLGGRYTKKGPPADEFKVAEIWDALTDEERELVRKLVGNFI